MREFESEHGKVVVSELDAMKDMDGKLLFEITIDEEHFTNVRAFSIDIAESIAKDEVEKLV